MPERRAWAAVALLVVASCTSRGAPARTALPQTALDVRALPLGTGHSSTSAVVGRLDRCHLPFGGPPVTLPPWVDSARGTWDLSSKASVAGSVPWSSKVTTRHVGSKLVVTSNGLPHRSGVFPVQPSDPAYAYNPDPSPVVAHTVNVTRPYDPQPTGRESCENGVVGLAIDGIPILDGFDAGGNDAVAVEVQDSCHGHPNDHAGYHYHALSPCLLDATTRRTSALVGWALDGFGIYVEYDAAGRLLTNAALDDCHGRTSVVPWHGGQVSTYHYDMTLEFPYSVGCFRGTPVGSEAATGLGLPPSPRLVSMSGGPDNVSR